MDVGNGGRKQDGNMKIVLINTVANTGSTGRIVSALYKGIERQSDKPCIVYGRGACNIEMQSYKTGGTVDFICHVFRNFFKGEGGFGSKKATVKLVNYLQKERPDLIHLHNIHGFYLNCEILFDYIKKTNIPVVWTLHDCWAFTGHCAYFDYVQCNKWQSECNLCIQHRKAYPYSLFCDNSKSLFAKKKTTFQGVENLTIVTPSHWLEGLVKKSFLKEYPVKVIYNGIDRQNFYMDKAEKAVQAGSEKKIVLGVANVWEKRKGLKYFKELADKLDHQYQIVIVGVKRYQQYLLKLKYSSKKLLPITRTESVDELRRLYNQAAVFVNTTLEDNFPTTNLEALACGTPVITFNTGGSPESINEKCGMIVEKGNIDQLIEAINKICYSGQFTVEHCMEQSKKYTNDEAVERYLSLYAEIINYHQQQ